MPRALKLKGVSRIDQPEKMNHGYFVRVDYKGAARRGWFSDSQYGTKTAALRAANEAALAMHRELGKPLTKRRVYTTARSGTGHLGVSEAKSGYLVSDLDGNREYVSYDKGLRHAVKRRKALATAAYAADPIR